MITTLSLVTRLVTVISATIAIVAICICVSQKQSRSHLFEIQEQSLKKGRDYSTPDPSTSRSTASPTSAESPDGGEEHRSVKLKSQRHSHMERRPGGARGGRALRGFPQGSMHEASGGRVAR